MISLSSVFDALTFFNRISKVVTLILSVLPCQFAFTK